MATRRTDEGEAAGTSGKAPRRLWRPILAILLLGVAGAIAWFMLAGAPPAPTVADIAYGPSKAQTFDVWRPEGKGPFPVVLAIHGGAFAFGDKRSHDGLAADIRMLRAHSIAVASANYRMSGEAKFPAATQDVVAAIAELRRRAPELRLHPARVALWGKSAGANLVLLAGLSSGKPPIGDGAVAPVSAIVAMYPPTQFDMMDAQLRGSACGERAATHSAADSPESVWLGAPVSESKNLVAAASPMTYVTVNAPPVLLQAGSADCVVGPGQSMILAARLKAVGAPYRFDVLPGADHIDPTFDRASNLAVVVQFLQHAFVRQAAR